MNDFEKAMTDFAETIKDIFSKMDIEESIEFMRIFNEKMKELHEQTNLQKNPGTSG